MKKIIILIIGIITAVPAFCQLDTLRDGDLYFFPKGYGPTKEPARITIRLKMGEVYDHVMMGGMKYWYMAESNVDSLNQVGDKIRVLSIQVPYTMYFGLAERKKLQDLINSFIVPSNPDPVQIDTVDSEALTYTGWARHGATSAPGWYDGTISYSSTGEASYTFTGTRVQIFGETKPSDGTGTVTIGDKTVTAQYNKAQVLPAMVFDSGVMPRDTHTMILKPQSGSINIDFLVITK